MGGSHNIIVVEKGIYSGGGGGGRFWEGRVAHTFVEKVVYSGREGYILGGSHIVVEKGGIFWEGGVDSGSRIHFT